MESLADKIKKSAETPYQMIARELESTSRYVAQIARGERIPQRGKGLKIKARLEELIKEQTL